jgi:hypothetical protein
VSNTRGRKVAIAILAVVGGLLALNLLARGLDQSVGGNQPGGASGSSYATGSDGVNAYASLLTRFGHPIARVRGSLADARLDPAATVMVVDPQSLTHDEAAALASFAGAGGRLVIGGPQPFYLRQFATNPPRWSSDGAAQYDRVDPVFTGVHLVATAAAGSFTNAGSGRALVQSGAQVLLTQDRVGSGEIFFLADVSALENAYLGTDADNAAFALALAGASGRTVVFAEGVHGFGTTRGLRAIPTRWKIALGGFALAALCFVASRAWRMGPPDRESRKLAPARAEYVRALSLSLERTRDAPGALTPLRQWARARVAARTALAPDAPDEMLDRAARALGCTDSERAALHAPLANDDDVLALGHLVARVTDDGRFV